MAALGTLASTYEVGKAPVLGSVVRTVGSTGLYSTIASALAAASSGDVVYLQPGTYSENNLSVPSGVDLVGLSPRLCKISVTSGTNPLATFAGSNYVSGIDFYSDSSTRGGIVVSGSGVEIERCQFEGSSDQISISATAAGRVYIHDNVFSDCRYDIMRSNGASTSTLTIDVVRNTVRSSLASDATSGVFFSIYNSGSPRVNLIDNDIRWETTVDAVAYGFFEDANISTGEAAFVTSRGNSFRPKTTTGNCNMFLFTTGGSTFIRHHAIVDSSDDTMLAETISGTVSIVIGNTASSGRDPGQLACRRGVFRYRNYQNVSAANWTDASKTVTLTGAFANYTFNSGDYLQLTAGTGITAATYRVSSKTSNDAIVLTTDINGAGGDIADNSLVGVLTGLWVSLGATTANNTRTSINGTVGTRAVSMDTAYQPNLMSDTLVVASVQVDSGAAGDGKIEAMSDSASTPTTVVATFRVGTALTIIGAPLVFVVRAGHYYKLTGTDTAGTPTQSVVGNVMEITL